MDYSDMKATQESRAESISEALSEIMGGGEDEKPNRKKTNNKKKSTAAKSAAGGNKSSSSAKKSSSKSSSGSSSSSSSKNSKTLGASKSSGSSKRSRTSKSSNSSGGSNSSGSSGSKKYKEQSSISYGKSSGSNTTRKIATPSAKLNLPVLFGAIFLIISIAIGFFAGKMLLKNDVYEMVAYENGLVDIIIGSEDSENEGQAQYYKELGVKCVAFGKTYKNYGVKYYYRNDLTQDPVEVERVDESVEGIYYAIYTSPSRKYKSVRLIRNIIVLRGEDNEQEI